MRHRDKHAFLLGIVVLAHLGIDARLTTSRVARSPFRIIVEHEPLTGVVDQLPARPAQPFLQARCPSSAYGPRQKTGGMELHHFHIAQRQARSQSHRQPVHRLVARRRVILDTSSGRHPLPSELSWRGQTGSHRCACRSSAHLPKRFHPWSGSARSRDALAAFSTPLASTFSIRRLMISMPVRSPL